MRARLEKTIGDIRCLLGAILQVGRQLDLTHTFTVREREREDKSIISSSKM